MRIANKSYTLELNDRDGAIVSLRNSKGREFIHAGGSRPLFTLNFRDAAGKEVRLDSKFTTKTAYKKLKSGVNFSYEKLGGLDINAKVSVRCPAKGGLSYWSISVGNGTDMVLEWVDFPDVVVPNDLIGAGGVSRILYPICEGVLVEDASLRERMGYTYHPVEYPCRGLEGLYPGSVQSQLMAYYGEGEGLYMAAHDPGFSVKSIEYRLFDGGVRFDYRLFTESSYGEDFELPYEMALGVFEGDWHDAASIYRDWLESSKALAECPKLSEDSSLPKWYFDSPVVVTYPVRGTHDLDKMDPNEYYPYVNALPVMDRLAKDFEAPLLVLLMHWESTAPWAPPYVWPPYGGEDKLLPFLKGLHERGHFLGVYASGLGWSLKSLVTDYVKEGFPEGRDPKESMCVAPDGSLPLSKICPAHRQAYDLCPAGQATIDIVCGEIEKIASAGVDYIQYFDQNMGGGGYFCYAKNHGHPPVPGRWMTDGVVNLLHKAKERLAAVGKGVVMGCEAAAAEPFIFGMRLNDLRYNVDMLMGKPVPLYSFLYHEFINNFMGNQVCSGGIIDVKSCPDNLLFRTAYSFVSGDLLTVVLKDGGQMHWAWGARWEVEAPAQDPLKELIRNLSAARRGFAKEFLCYGRMLKPFPVEGVGEIGIQLHTGDILEYPLVLTSRWLTPSGREAQLLVNFTGAKHAGSVSIGDRSSKALVHSKVGSEERPVAKDGRIVFSMEPFSVQMIEFV